MCSISASPTSSSTSLRLSRPLTMPNLQINGAASDALVELLVAELRERVEGGPLDRQMTPMGVISEVVIVCDSSDLIRCLSVERQLALLKHRAPRAMMLP